MITLAWDLFNEKYMNTSRIFVLETDSAWELFTYEGIFKITTTVEKREDQTENMMFVERYFSNKPNVMKVLEIDDFEEIDQTEIFQEIPEPDFVHEQMEEDVEGMTEEEVEQKKDYEGKNYEKKNVEMKEYEG